MNKGYNYRGDIDGKLTPAQEEARRAAGYELPRPKAPRSTEKEVPTLTLVECQACGCTNGRPLGARLPSCCYCGADL